MKYYHLKYRLKMSHSVDNIKEHAHKHVLETEFYLKPVDESNMFAEFKDIETNINDKLNVYQNRYLNEYPEFGADASLEHTGETIYGMISDNLLDKNWKLVCFEISENPLRVYIIRDDAFDMRCI